MNFFGGQQEPQGPDPVFAAKTEMEMYTGSFIFCSCRSHERRSIFLAMALHLFCYTVSIHLFTNNTLANKSFRHYTQIYLTKLRHRALKSVPLANTRRWIFRWVK